MHLILGRPDLTVVRRVAVGGLLAATLSVPIVATEPASADVRTTCRGVPATIVGTDRVDRIRGTAGRDVISAGDGNDIIWAGGGGDLVCGGTGADRIEGGGGDDRLFGELDRLHPDDSAIDGDALDGGRGDDLLDPGLDPARTSGDYDGGPEEVRFRHGGGRVKVDLPAGQARGQGKDRIVVDQGLSVIGSDGDDVVVGSDFGDWVNPRKGDDVVRAGAGEDWVYEEWEANDTGRDRFLGGPDYDRMLTHDGRDVLVGGAGTDHFLATQPHAVLRGGEDDDVLAAFFQEGQVLDGGPGRDLLDVGNTPEKGTAEMDVAAGELRISRHTVVAAAFERFNLVVVIPLTFRGTDANEELSAPAVGRTDAPLTAYLGGGDDVVVVGTRGDDVVDGGPGLDTADLAEGNDTCVDVELGPC